MPLYPPPPALEVTPIQTADYVAGVNQLVQCDPTAGGFLVTIPPAGGAAGRLVVVVNVGTSADTIKMQPSPGDTINMAGTLAINIAFGALTFCSDGGTNWMLIAVFPSPSVPV